MATIFDVSINNNAVGTITNNNGSWTFTSGSRNGSLPGNFSFTSAFTIGDYNFGAGTESSLSPQTYTGNMLSNERGSGTWKAQAESK